MNLTANLPGGTTMQIVIRPDPTTILVDAQLVMPTGCYIVNAMHVDQSNAITAIDMEPVDPSGPRWDDTRPTLTATLAATPDL